MTKPRYPCWSDPGHGNQCPVLLAHLLSSFFDPRIILPGGSNLSCFGPFTDRLLVLSFQVEQQALSMVGVQWLSS
jgi:hypothetical protein